MKVLFMPVLFLSAVLLSTSCRNHNGSYGNFVINEDNKKTTINVDDESGSLKIVCKGDVTFTDDDQGIASISDDGYVKYTRNGKRLLAENGSGGIVYKINNGAEGNVLDQDNQKFLAAAIRVMINHGIDAQGRVQRLYNKGGSGKVIDEVKLLESDYVKRIYLEFLLSRQTLTKNELLIVAQQVTTLIDSDYDKSQLLEHSSKQFSADAETIQAYLVAVKSIDSDYEKSRALKNIFQYQLNPDQYAYAISVVNDIGSDYEKSAVLKEVLEHRQLDSSQYIATIKAISGINGDYEKSGVLKDLISHHEGSGTYISELITATNSVQSDYERSGVLKELINQPLSSEDEWVEVINAASKLSSDYEKSNILTDIANRMGTSEKVKTAYSTAAKTLNSEHEYKKAMEAVR